MKLQITFVAAIMLVATAMTTLAQNSATDKVPSMSATSSAPRPTCTSGALLRGRSGKIHHSREPANIDNQTVIRMNRDTLYSQGFSISMPGRSQSRCQMLASVSCR